MKSKNKISIVVNVLNICAFVFNCILFIFNQLCNLKFWGLWEAWNLSGYAFFFLTAPAGIILSILSLVLMRKKYGDIKRRFAFIVISIITLIITSAALLSAFFTDAFTWC